MEFVERCLGGGRVAALERFRSELELAVKHRAAMIAAGLRPPDPDPVPLRRLA